MVKMTINWTGFQKKTPHERQDVVSKLLSEENNNTLTANHQLPLEVADQMSENVIGTLALPFAIAPDFLINGKSYNLPMVTEEPSVVAAASFAAKIIKRSGGFQTIVHNRLMIGQVALYDVPDGKAAQTAIAKQKNELIDLANQAHPSIVKRGGGARELRCETKGDFLIVYLSVDTKEAMGANMLNTMLEAIAPRLEQITGALSLMAILSNYATDSLVTATCRVNTRFLSRDKDQAHLLAKKMALASQLAQVDPYRSATHNKGIFNGIDALVIATGNDWRAIEAAGHSYASHSGTYQGLSTWSYNEEKEELLGQLTLPMPVATKGGSIALNPTVQVAHDMLGQPTARELASITVSLGLAQNFAALKALVSEGIQAGHMKLQAKSLLLSAGASQSDIPSLLPELLKAPHRNLETAQQLLDNFRNS